MHVRAAALLTVLFLFVTWVSAQPAPGYEDTLIAWGLDQVQRTVDPEPEGKIVEEVLVASEDIVAESDPYPNVLNAVHWRTKDVVIRRELLIEVGQPYRADLIDETERNLRQLGIFAIARIVAVRGSGPDRVAILVVTKDLWSLRINSQYNLVGTLLQYLRIRPTEQNFLGLNKRLSLDFEMRLDTLMVGQAYTDSRLLGTRLSLTESAALIFNRDTWEAEGSVGGISFSRPLYSLETEWGFASSFAWDVRRQRNFRGADIWQREYAPDATVPFIYDQRAYAAGGAVTRSFGRELKTNVGVGLGYYARQYDPPDDLGLTDAQREALVARFLPRTEDALYLSSSVTTYSARYVVLRDINTFALAEDIQLGHLAGVQLRFAPGVFGLERYVEAGVRARYRWYVEDALLTVAAAGAARFFAEGFGRDVVDERVATEIELITPRILIGRFVARGLADFKYDDINRVPFQLGGGNGLRGTAPELLAGMRRLLVNVEYRTRPIEIRTLHLGGVLFWDAGSAFDHDPTVIHTLGLGLRLSFPQFDVSPLRIDVGYVLNGPLPANGIIGASSSSFGQVTNYGSAFLDDPLD